MSLQLSRDYPWKEQYEDFVLRKSDVIPQVELHPYDMTPISFLYDMKDYVVWLIPLDQSFHIPTDKVKSVLNSALSSVSSGLEISTQDEEDIKDIVLQAYKSISVGTLGNAPFLKKDGWNRFDDLTTLERKQLFSKSEDVRVAISDENRIYQIDSMFILDLRHEQMRKEEEKVYPVPELELPREIPREIPRISDELGESIIVVLQLNLLILASSEESIEDESEIEKLNEKITVIWKPLVKDFRIGVPQRPIDVIYNLNLHNIQKIAELGKEIKKKIDEEEIEKQGVIELLQKESKDILSLTRLAFKIYEIREIPDEILAEQFVSLTDLVMGLNNTAQTEETKENLKKFYKEIVKELIAEKRKPHLIEKGIASDTDVTHLENAPFPIQYLISRFIAREVERNIEGVGRMTDGEIQNIIKDRVDKLLSQGMFRSFEFIDKEKYTIFDVLVSIRQYKMDTIFSSLEKIGKLEGEAFDTTFNKLLNDYYAEIASFFDMVMNLRMARTMKDPDFLSPSGTIAGTLKSRQTSLSLDEAVKKVVDQEKETLYSVIAGEVNMLRTKSKSNAKIQDDPEDEKGDEIDFNDDLVESDLSEEELSIRGTIPDVETLRSALESGNYAKAQMAFDSGKLLDGEEWEDTIYEIEQLEIEHEDLLDEWEDVKEKIKESKKVS
jgi:hypothetical protein